MNTKEAAEFIRQMGKDMHEHGVANCTEAQLDKYMLACSICVSEHDDEKALMAMLCQIASTKLQIKIAKNADARIAKAERLVILLALLSVLIGFLQILAKPGFLN